MKTVLLFSMIVNTLLFTNTSCKFFTGETSDKKRVEYLLDNTWHQDVGNALDDTTDYKAFQTAEFRHNRFFLETLTALYQHGTRPDTIPSFYYFTGNFHLTDLWMVNDSSASGICSFDHSTLDTLFSYGHFLFFSPEALNQPRSVFSVWYRSIDSTIIETFFDPHFRLHTDTLKISGMAILKFNSWYQLPHPTEFRAYVYESKARRHRGNK